MSSDNRQFDRDIRRIHKNIDAIADKIGPGATVQAANRVLRSAQTIAVKRIADDTPDEIKQKHIRRRMFARNMSLARPRAYMHGYINDMPAISLLDKTTPTGRILHSTQVRDVRRLPKRSPGAKRSRAKPKASGVRIGAKTFQEAFVQKTKKGQVHLFRRKQFRTWAKGSYGWPGGGKTRAPFELLKYDLKKPFRKHFRPAVDESIAKNYQKEFDRAYVRGLAKLQVKK